ncbi:MAG: hypothetical protein CBC29_02590 [Methylococcaceae bacterium TMED69]|nr:MAG: hypothetical protein CBC29_02590 [Methylococcaceae bacterium TMED69]|tara:strand:- start:1868 stop:3934 length:2067 start_codon:yes stop_codon:yes gene_type:complete
MTKHQKLMYFLSTLFCLLLTSLSYAENSIKDLKFEKTNFGSEIIIYLSKDIPETPKIFATEKPATIAIDFSETRLGLQENRVNVGQNGIKNIFAVETETKTRVIVNLDNIVPYEYKVNKNQVVLAIPNETKQRKVISDNSNSIFIEKIDFEVGKKGAGKVVIDFSKADIDIDVNESGNNINIRLPGVTVPDDLAQKIDVSELETQVILIALLETDKDNPLLKIYNKSKSNFSTYQTDKRLTLEVIPQTDSQIESGMSEFTGEKLSLNFQDIEVRAILQLLADFTDKNLVASDSVGGNLTLRLKNVPWDQALDIILKARGLGKREIGNVMMVAPQEELTARERLEMESKQQYLELSPLKTEFIQVNYAKASDMANIIKDEANNLISERGNVSVDERTNTLLVQETSEYLREIKTILKALDIPVKQVQIESKIVIANDDFSRGLGVKLGYSVRTSPLVLDGAKTNNSVIIGGGIGGDTSVATGTGFLNADNASTPQENYQVSLPITSPTGALKMFVGRQGSYLLNLELQAAQAEGRGEIVSSPTVITANQREATIESGTEIPYLEASSSGATSVSFKKAVLSLKVTPQITPDKRIIMDLRVNKDSVGTIFSGIPSIDTNNLITQVLVENGETVVLGGVYETTETNNRGSIPLLGDIPMVGVLFRNKTKTQKKKELLVFITPQIIDQTPTK